MLSALPILVQNPSPFLLCAVVLRAQNEEGGWALMKPVVFGAIMDFFSEGKAVMLDEPVVTDTTILDDDDEVVAMIKELLQERVRTKSDPCVCSCAPRSLSARMSCHNIR